MMLFWVICAILIIIAFAFVLPTAFQRDDKSRRAIADDRKLANIAVYRDQLSELEADLQNGVVSRQQYEQDRDEIERRLLEDTATATAATKKPTTAPAASRNTAYALVFALPLAAVIFYFQVGNPKSITDPTGGVSAPPASSQTGERSQAQIEANVAALAERLKANPSDADGWIMLARSYRSMERFGEAAGAYAKATELRPNDADLWVQYAVASAMANDQRLEGQPTELLNQALKVDPENASALQLAGSAAFQKQDYAKAVEYWERALKKAPDDSEIRQALQARINEAKTLAGSK